MIRISLNWAISIYLLIFLLLVIGHWIIYTFTRFKYLSFDLCSFRECPVCTRILRVYRNDSYRTCPQCHSYIFLEDNPNDPTSKSIRNP